MNLQTNKFKIIQNDDFSWGKEYKIESIVQVKPHQIYVMQRLYTLGR